MALNFNDVLNTKLEDIVRPPLIPVGHYVATVRNIPSLGNIGKNQEWDTVDFNLQLTEAKDDVDQEALTTYGGLGKHSNINRRFMFNKEDQAAFDRSLYNLKRFLEDHLRVAGAKDAELKQSLNDAIGCSCIVFIKHRQDRDDKELFYAEVGQTAPTE